jgi:hypothetical protein
MLWSSTQSPTSWQPNPHVLDQYEPGDALGMVCGHKVDGVDTDPRPADLSAAMQLVLRHTGTGADR